MRIHSWCCPSSVDFDKCIMVLFIHYNIHYHDVIWSVFTALKILCASSGLPSSKLPTSRQPLVFLLSLIVLPVPECYIVANVQPFHIGFLYFHGLTVYFVLVLFHCLDVCQFVYPFTYWRTSWWLPVWTVMNKAAAINLVPDSFWCIMPEAPTHSTSYLSACALDPWCLQHHLVDLGQSCHISLSSLPERQVCRL